MLYLQALLFTAGVGLGIREDWEGQHLGYLTQKLINCVCLLGRLLCK